MKDSEFKALKHPVGHLTISSRGTVVSPGYKPDLTICDQGRLTHIIESERKTDRKAFLGDLVKACRHAQELGLHPKLVIVMQPAGNTTPNQIANQLSIYAGWLAKNLSGGMSLSGIQIMTHSQYQSAIDAGIRLDSQDFDQLGIQVPVAL
jgi:hypothetical protein